MYLKGLLLQDCVRDQLAEFLPRALEKALASYHAHMDQDIKGTDFSFSTYHKDSKVAISHVELLIKLAKWVDESAPQDQAPLIPEDILALAEEDIAAFRELD